MRQGCRSAEQGQHQRNEVEFIQGRALNLELQARPHDSITLGDDRIMSGDGRAVFRFKFGHFPPLHFSILVTDQGQEFADGEVLLGCFVTGFTGDFRKISHPAQLVVRRSRIAVDQVIARRGFDFPLDLLEQGVRSIGYDHPPAVCRVGQLDEFLAFVFLGVQNRSRGQGRKSGFLIIVERHRAALIRFRAQATNHHGNHHDG